MDNRYKIIKKYFKRQEESFLTNLNNKSIREYFILDKSIEIVSNNINFGEFPLVKYLLISYKPKSYANELHKLNKDSTYHHINIYTKNIIKEYSNIYLILKVKITYECMFKPPKYNFVSLDHNITTDIQLTTLCKQIIYTFEKNDHGITWSPATSIEKDILSFIVIFIENINFFNNK